jgi:GNAT superfamily N-acetyltransferase
MMHVRSAQNVDFEAVTSLLEELGRPRVSDDDTEEARSVYEAQLADEASDHLVAVGDADEVIGFCSLHYRARLNHARSEQAWIPDLIVREAVRGTGAGRALLEEARSRAEARGCHDITLESSYTRERAHAVYLAAGYEDLGKFFRREPRP